MKEIVINITPFILNQTLFVFENGTLISSENFLLKDIAAAVFSKDNIKKITLCGNKTYVKKFQQALQKEEFKKYKTNNIIFEIKETTNG